MRSSNLNGVLTRDGAETHKGKSIGGHGNLQVMKRSLPPPPQAKPADTLTLGFWATSTTEIYSLSLWWGVMTVPGKLLHPAYEVPQWGGGVLAEPLGTMEAGLKFKPVGVGKGGAVHHRKC